jgi:hypothetical protein
VTVNPDTWHGMIDSNGTALLTIRAWCEEDSRSPLRAQVRSTSDVSSGFRSTVTVTDIDEAVRAVRAFLEEVVHSPPRASPGTTWIWL